MMNRSTGKALFSSVVVLLMLATVSFAQETPRADVSVEYSHLQILQGYTIDMNGGSAALAVNLNRWIGVVGDFGVYHGNPGESLTGETYTFGPRLSYRNASRFTPFAQALFGASHFSASSGGISGGGGNFAFGLGGGVDIGLGKSQKFAVRPQAEYFGLRENGSTTDSARLSVGIVYRIGQK
jgi:hypothetical protein